MLHTRGFTVCTWELFQLCADKVTLPEKVVLSLFPNMIFTLALFLSISGYTLTCSIQILSVALIWISPKMPFQLVCVPSFT